ncbi:MAG: helix-hairpin-helix domain-containing protein [Candidatus Eisenbacteria bacterium]|nr:helix-hairpin-helix domain-containing protein [Candidatus Eisenbacteria bacterium]
MRWPEFLEWTTEERRAVLAVLLFTGGGGLILELGRRFPDWTPDLLLVSSLDRHRVTADSARVSDTLAVPEASASDDSVLILAGLGAAAPGDAARPGGEPSRRKESHPKTPAGPVNINHADAARLTSLPGVGPKLAERIVLDRAANGRYRSLADLDRVKGVGPSLLQKLSGLVVTESASDSTLIQRP